jgi:archaemetzincin
MNPISLVAIGNPRRALLDVVRPALARAFGTDCRHETLRIDPRPMYHSERNQYHSTELLQKLVHANGGQSILLGITDVDLFIPILTFVFGEAQLGGSAAVISHHRLHQEFYGLPADETLLRERVVKEAIHEVGHVAGLTHCQDYDCVMAASHSVEWLDVKGNSLCTHCRAALT